VTAKCLGQYLSLREGYPLELKTVHLIKLLLSFIAKVNMRLLGLKSFELQLESAKTQFETLYDEIYLTSKK
jgi:hypothetical protein